MPDNETNPSWACFYYGWYEGHNWLECPECLGQYEAYLEKMYRRDDTPDGVDANDPNWQEDLLREIFS